MGSNVAFYCGRSDNEDLQDFAESIGLYLVPPMIDKTLAPKAELHPYMAVLKSR